MFRAAYRSSSGASNCICSIWFIYPCGKRPVTTWVYIPEAANTVWSCWWWAVCRSKHVEPSINFGIINSITRLHLVGCFYWFMKCYYLGDIFLNNFVRGSTAPLGPRPPYCWGFYIIHTLGRTPPNVWSVRSRGRYLHNTQQTQQTNIHVLSGTQTLNTSFEIQY